MARKKQSTSRAQAVRNRRKKNKRQPASSGRGQRETSSRGLPPVMVRGGGFSSSKPKKTKRGRKAVKRRYDIAMAAPGVEIRLPSVPNIRLGWRLASFVLTAGLIILLYYMWTSPMFQVQVAEIQGAIRLTGNDINRALNVYNKPIFTLNPQDMENTLRIAYPDLKDVSVQVGFPALVVVNINERVPRLAWIGKDGIKWVDAEGYAFSPRGDAENLIIVEAYADPPMPAQILDVESTLTAFAAPTNIFVAPTAFLPPELVTAILTLGHQAPEGIPLVYDPQHGLGWNDSRGWDVYFGMEVASLDEKLLVYDAIVERLQGEGITPALINVEHVHAPIYRLSR